MCRFSNVNVAKGFIHSEEEKLRNVIQDFPVLLTFSFKAYKHVMLLK